VYIANQSLCLLNRTCTLKIAADTGIVVLEVAVKAQNGGTYSRQRCSRCERMHRQHCIRLG